MNLTELPIENIQMFGTYTNLIYEDRAYTNTECEEQASKLAHYLQGIGVSHGDRVIVTMPNRPEALWSYSAIAKAGAVTVPVMPLLQASELRFIAEDCTPKAIITANLLFSKVQEAVRDLQPVPLILCVDAVGDDALDVHLAQYPATPPTARIHDDDTCVILYTSGTTGRPKGVVLSHRNLYSNAKAAADVARGFAEQTDLARVGLVVLPLSHAFGFTMLQSSYFSGDKSVLLPFFDPKLVFTAIEKYKVTHFSGVPAMFHAMLHHPDADKYDLSSLSLCISGSAPMAARTIEEFAAKFNCPIYEGYGLSEAAPVVTAPRADDVLRPGSVGRPLPGVDVRVVDASDKPLPTGEVGELVVRGPNITKGYHNLPDESAKVLKDGWLYTGDMARIDDDGYVFIVERKKDVIIRGGFNIYPRDLEDLLLSHEAVSEVAVFGVPSEAMGEEVVAYVVKRPKTEVTEEELVAYCQEKLAKYKTPRYIKIVSNVPKNLVGKIDKKLLREQAQKDVKLS
ncbi:class I adenylate-forming enzyme family protein [Alicyclobacillus sp. ALC3]|uniref:class I adenylate-forming enzyme family protein n=1 Tax=Alicyclobacillus sp. ALC3 TaxID=2796143 RepID=UPI0023787BFE|nr:long-chain fatty acid--CoA ligase [Alicyclobacillus sp. ALC3]WDL95849.1 long-chain fatty acid--CoA ligase [Alicyclobacillus sp. ALC3]